ncbi:MAG TPA: hypothetical protein VGQ59_14760 [Cyclobacteriaceae bacterium]|jgi:hypothetical protein|nr:hypothetical protein [Cyclobacteriaceae bacterium]
MCALLREGWSGMFEPEMECAQDWRVATARPEARRARPKNPCEPQRSLRLNAFNRGGAKKRRGIFLTRLR